MWLKNLKRKKVEKNQKNNEWIDDFLDDVDNPVVNDVGDYGYIDYAESLIRGSNNTGEEKKQLINSLQTMRKKEMDALVLNLKDNQIYNDCRDQFKQMCKNGVFNNKK